MKNFTGDYFNKLKKYFKAVDLQQQVFSLHHYRSNAQNS